MKKDKIIYRTSTGIIAFVMLFSIINFTFFDRLIYPEGAFQHLHLPGYFKVELTTAKALGLLALLIPSVPGKIKEFAYFGFAITLASAIIAHSSIGDKWYNIVDPAGFLVVLAVSYLYFIRLRKASMQAYTPIRQTYRE